LKETPSWLFVYGTLLDKQNEFGAYLNAKCSFYAEGRFNYVYGKIFLVNDPDNVLKQLDYYEGFGADQVKPNLFTRERMPIETSNEPVKCWVYLYNLPVNGFRLIKSGRYLP
jgi:gamma-glutamylcyclotransferase (GGCT)/AIG2-like uncharacterized protein YtfP